ncbi:MULTISPECIES: thioredoxin family protein [Kitasatospora]|uniref:Thiol-disulfide isomerase/thioredoxin n=2 Tax=Kitasatospora TaxID=2063 RepID=A0ABT1J8E0_9ACTN|nr:thioredoxin family protein [Kitasatospora paracochleata]MCP2313705.1 thiol-disulfide isomerase/thioredoxin [Kitasatospora paracochleata]
MRRSPLLLVLAVGATAGLTACGPTDSAAPGSAASQVAAVVPSGDAALPEPINIVTAPPETGTPTAAAPTESAKPSAKATSATPKPATSTKSGGGAAAGSAGNPTTFGYSATADSPAAVDAAMKQAKADGRNVLLDFGATWCGNCKALDKVFGDSKVQSALNASYHLVQVDIGDHSTANFNLLKKYDSQGSYKMPVLIVVTPDGQVRTDTNTAGLPSLTASGFGDFLRKWAP